MLSLCGNYFNIRYIIRFLLLFFAVFIFPVLAQSQQKGYFVQFADKDGSPFSADHPHEFLSQRAIDRRARQNISIDDYDIPVNAHYVDAIENLGAIIKHTTRWMNGAIVFCTDDVAGAISSLPYVASVEVTWEPPKGRSLIMKYTDDNTTLKAVTSLNQLEMVGGHHLHNEGYTGEGMQIAILDAGFFNVDNTTALQHVFNDGRLLGYKDFVGDGSQFYNTHTHGQQVFSVIAAKANGWMVGSAPDASYYLFRTESSAYEYPIEPDYWICAAELADSLGVDVVQSSLGYFYFDNSTMNYTHDMLNGTTRISRAASIAAQKGMIVVNSAGNERGNSWQYVIMPADAPEVLTVGAVSSDGVLASFSSLGSTVCKSIKPDVVALGVNTRTVAFYNMNYNSNGTSFASPIISGLAACLWQAHPDKSAAAIVEAIRQSGNRFSTPDFQYGYGIPDFGSAGGVVTPADDLNAGCISVYPNPFNEQISIFIPDTGHNVRVEVMNIDGRLMWNSVVPVGTLKIPASDFAAGVYIIRIDCGTFVKSQKLIKR